MHRLPGILRHTILLLLLATTAWAAGGSRLITPEDLKRLRESQGERLIVLDARSA